MPGILRMCPTPHTIKHKLHDSVDWLSLGANAEEVDDVFMLKVLHHLCLRQEVKFLRDGGAQLEGLHCHGHLQGNGGQIRLDEVRSDQNKEEKEKNILKRNTGGCGAIMCHLPNPVSQRGTPRHTRCQTLPRPACG